MDTWPNWVDLVIVTLFLRACYTGYYRGVCAEFFSLVGIISATALTFNYTSLLTKRLASWFRLDPAIVAFPAFCVLLLSLYIAATLLVRFLTRATKWEPSHALIQWTGLLGGAARGLWWSGLLLVALVSIGLPYGRRSVEQRSVIGPWLVEPSRKTLGWVADMFPGAAQRGVSLVPPMALPQHDGGL